MNPSIPGVTATAVSVGVCVFQTSSMTLMEEVPKVGGVPEVDRVPVDLVEAKPLELPLKSPSIPGLVIVCSRPWYWQD